jgi:uncharacterized membrane protein
MADEHSEPPTPDRPAQQRPADPPAAAPAPAAPTSARRDWTEQDVEQWIGMLLLVGVLLAAAVAAVGGVVYIIRYGSAHENYRVFHGVPRGLNTVHGVLAGALHLRSRWVIQLGLLLLIATPVARVALSLVTFAHQRDRLYVVVTAIVLTLLLYGLLGPGVG